MQVGDLTAVCNSSSHFDIEKRAPINDFNLIYQEQSKDQNNLQLILPYDLNKRAIDKHYGLKTVILVNGIPFECLIYNCHFHDVLIEVAMDQSHQIEFEPLNTISLQKWVRIHFLNDGRDPALSDSPHDVVFRLTFDNNQHLADANLLLYQIVKTYEEFLGERAKVELLTSKQAKEKYPLNLKFAIKSPPIPSSPSMDFDEIEMEIKEELNK